MQISVRQVLVIDIPVVFPKIGFNVIFSAIVVERILLNTFFNFEFILKQSLHFFSFFLINKEW